MERVSGYPESDSWEWEMGRAAALLYERGRRLVFARVQGHARVHGKNCCVELASGDGRILPGVPVRSPG